MFAEEKESIEEKIFLEKKTSKLLENSMQIGIPKTSIYENNISTKAKLIKFRWSVKRIADIDTSTQKFYAEFTIKLIWEPGPEPYLIEEAEKALKYLGQEAYDWEPSWKPEISFPNGLDVQLSSLNIGRTPFFSAYQNEVTKKLEIRYEFEIRASFMEAFELRSYPFDVQDLTLILKFGNAGGMEKYRLVPEDSKDTFGKIDLIYSTFTGWRQYLSVMGIGFTHQKSSKKQTSYPLIILKLKMQRKYSYYIKRIGSILMVLSLASLFSFSISPSSLSDRLNLVITLLLAVVAFQFTISSTLPVLSFLTFIDHYMMNTFVFVFLVGVIASINYTFHKNDEDKLEHIDYICFWTMFSIWIIFHIIIIIGIPIVVKKEERKLDPTYQANNFDASLIESLDDSVVAHHFNLDEEKFSKIMKERPEWVTVQAKPIMN